MGEAPIGKKKGDQQCGRHKDWTEEEQPEREGNARAQHAERSCVDALGARGMKLL
jgi:hypothetical protein